MGSVQGVWRQVYGPNLGDAVCLQTLSASCPLISEECGHNLVPVCHLLLQQVLCKVFAGPCAALLLIACGPAPFCSAGGAMEAVQRHMTQTDRSESHPCWMFQAPLPIRDQL